MFKKYISDIAFMQILNLLVKPIWILVIDRAVQNALPQEVYGNYFALYNFSLLFFIVLDLGLNSYNTTEIARDSGKIESIAGNIIGLKLLLVFVYLALAFGVGLLLGYDNADFKLLLVLCFLQIITSFNQFLRSIVSSLQKFKWDGVFMVLDRVLIIAICSFLIWSNVDGWSLTIHRFVYAQVIGVGCVSLILVLFLMNHLKLIQVSFRYSKIMPVLQKSWPFALLITLMGLFNYMDSVMLKYLVGDSEAGLYAMGYRLFYALLMFAQIFSGVLLPFFSKNINEHKIISQVSKYTSKFLLVVGFSALFTSHAYGNLIMEILYPIKADKSSSTVFILLMVGFLGSTLILVYGTLLTAARELKKLNYLALFSFVINLSLNLILIPMKGAAGAAIATLISQLIFGGICWILSYQRFHFDWIWGNYIRQIIGVISLWIMIVHIKQYLESVSVHLVFMAVAILWVAYLFKLFHVKHINITKSS